MPVKSNGHLVPAVGYLRASTDKQETSITDQQKHVQRYAEDKGYKLLRWYTDDGISGDDTERRVGFRRMMADATNGADFKAIICWDQSRFGRFSPQEASYWTFPLTKVGVQLVTVDKGPINWDEFIGWLTYSVEQHGHEQYLANLSNNVTRGHTEAANAGSWLGSPPYGYRIEGERKKKLLVLGEPGHVRVVQRIFRELVEERRSMGNIAERLNADGVVSPGAAKGIAARLNPTKEALCLRGRWHYDTVRVIVENPAYCGDYAGGRFSYGKRHHIGANGSVAKGKRRGPKPEAEWIVRRDHHEPIVDRETWDKAQAILAKGKSGHPRKPPEENQYLFAGLLRCGKCGCPMWGTDPKSKTYECGLFHQTRKGREYKGKDCGCEGTTVREDAILRSVAEHLEREWLSLDGPALAWRADRKELTPEDLPKAFAKMRKLVAPPREPAVNRQRAERQAKTLDGQIDKARRNLVHLDAEFIPAAQEEIRRLQSERDLLEAELRKRPPSEADVNAEAMAVLRSLYWLGVCFRLQADPMDGPKYDEYEGARLIGDFSPEIRHWLRNISGIVVHTEKRGSGFGVRHRFVGGEIVFREAGGNGIRENPHHRGDEPR
jgi:DNA invertase Pin-like site-specific DNA recombinase